MKSHQTRPCCTVIHLGPTAHPPLVKLFGGTRCRCELINAKGKWTNVKFRICPWEIIRNLRRTGEPRAARGCLVLIWSWKWWSHSVVTDDCLTETLHRVGIGSKAMRYLLWILEYLLLSKVMIRIIFSVIKILSEPSLSWTLKIIGNCFSPSMEEHTVQPECLLKLLYVLWILLHILNLYLECKSRLWF